MDNVENAHCSHCCLATAIFTRIIIPAFRYYITPSSKVIGGTQCHMGYYTFLLAHVIELSSLGTRSNGSHFYFSLMNPVHLIS